MYPGADRLPAEVLVMIFSYLPCEDLVKSVQFVCTWWQQVSWEKQLWKYVTYQPVSSHENVVETLKLSPQLRSLDLMCATIADDLIQFISDSCPNLERLHICWDSIYNYSHVRITHPVSQVKMLSVYRNTVFRLNFPYLDSIFPNLESLCIIPMRFNKKDLEHYLEKKQNTLHTLMIPCSTADDLCVLPCLSACTNLRNLDLYGVCNKVWSSKDVGYFPHILRLGLDGFDMSNENYSSPVFCSFPNITELVLENVKVNKHFFCIIACYCPELQKLQLHLWNRSFPDEEQLIRDTLRARPLERLSHLYIRGNKFLTDEGVKHILRLMPALIHLDLHDCELLTTGCLKFIYGINKLEVFKFDFCYKEPLHEFKYCDVKNKNLQLMFNNDYWYLETVRQQHKRVSKTSYRRCGIFLGPSRRSSWFKHCCFWCS